MIDIIKPEPKTYLEEWTRYMNDIQSRLISMIPISIKNQIEVREENENDWEYVILKDGRERHISVF